MNFYIDSSALVKLAVEEEESRALRTYIAESAGEARSSILTLVETTIALSRSVGGTRANKLIASGGPLLLWLPGLSVRLVPFTDKVATDASLIGTEHGLRSLDAIHVASAADLRANLSAVVTYDERMAGACRALGIPIASPGSAL